MNEGTPVSFHAMGQREVEAAEEQVCEMTLSSNPRFVSVVAEFVASTSARLIDNREISGRLYVAAHELFDNAVRYSIDGKSAVALRMKREGRAIRFSIQTTNHSTPDRCAELVQLFSEMHASPDRAAFYQSLLRRSARRAEGSGLGLGRVYAEVHMDLSYQIEGDVVHTKAETSVSLHGDHS